MQPARVSRARVLIDEEVAPSICGDFDVGQTSPPISGAGASSPGSVICTHPHEGSFPRTDRVEAMPVNGGDNGKFPTAAYERYHLLARRETT